MAELAAAVGGPLAEELERLTVRVYERAAGLARDHGLLLADTKLEFGHDADGALTLGDEVLTPDSSRFWPADDWRVGARPAVVRQAVRPRLAAAGVRLGPDRTAAAAAGRRRASNGGPLPRGVPATHRGGASMPDRLPTGPRSERSGATPASHCTRRSTPATAPRTVVVEVMLKAEILDPQGQAVAAALPRLGVTGVPAVRQGKRFELTVEGEPDREAIERVAATLLANPVIEDFVVRWRLRRPLAGPSHGPAPARATG